MENKKTGIIIASVAVILFVGVVLFVLYDSEKNTNEEIKIKDDPIVYSELQNDFAIDLPCGVTDFDSPYVEPVQCDEKKMKKGELVTIKLKGSVVDMDGNGVPDVKIVVNNGKEFYTNKAGFFENDILVDSNKKLINVVANKFGYSPVMQSFNAQSQSSDSNYSNLPEVFNVNFLMKQIEVQDINLNGEETIIKSQKYPGVTLTIPANGLENSKGEIVKGKITGEITYLNPNKQEDIAFVPGFNGTVKQMVGVNTKGEQVTLESKGLVIFHLKEEGTDEILQPRKGVVLTITQPMLEEDYKSLTDPELIEAQKLTEADLDFYREKGITDDMSEEEQYNALREQDLIGLHYWYFNERTGLWEAWPISGFDVDLDKKIYIMKVPRLY